MLRKMAATATALLLLLGEALLRLLALLHGVRMQRRAAWCCCCRHRPAEHIPAWLNACSNQQTLVVTATQAIRPMQIAAHSRVVTFSSSS